MSAVVTMCPEPGPDTRRALLQAAKAALAAVQDILAAVDLPEAKEPPGSSARVNLKEAAAMMRVSPPQVATFIRRGELPAERLGARTWRIRTKDVEEFTRRRRTTA